MRNNTIYSLLVSLIPFQTAFSESINIAYDSWCPWMCDNVDKPGLAIELVESIFKTEGIHVEFQRTAWSAALREVREGKIIGILGAAKGEAPDFLFTNTPIGYQQMCFYVKSSLKWRYKNIESLKNKNVAIVQGANYPGIMEYLSHNNANKKTKLTQIISEDIFNSGFKLLLSNSADVFITDSVTSDHYLKENGYEDQFKKSGCLKAENLFLALTPKNKERSIKFIQIFNNNLLSIKLTDEYQKLYDKYNIQNWEIK